MPDLPQPTAPNMRTFSLNSEEAYEILCPRASRPWIMNGSLPREPRRWESWPPKFEPGGERGGKR